MSGVLDGLLDGLNSTLGGLRTTWRFAQQNWFGDGAITVQYPEQAPTLSPRFRGHLHNRVADCITCSACAKACPVDCFTIEGERNEQNKLRPSRFDIDLTKCIYCGLCTRACPTDCLTFAQDFTTSPEKHAPAEQTRFLFRVAPEQVDSRLDSLDVARLARIGSRPRDQLSDEDRAFLDRIEDPDHGQTLLARYGVGYYTAEEKTVVDAKREAEKQRKAAEAAAKAAAAKVAAPAAAPAQPPAGQP